MKYGYYLILNEMEEIKNWSTGFFSTINLKGRLILFNYSRLIKEVIDIIELEKDVTKKSNLLIYFRNEELIGVKLMRKLLGGCLKYDVGYNSNDIEFAFTYLNIECKKLKEKIDNYKNGNIVYDTLTETIERLKPFYSEEEIKEEVKHTKKISIELIDFKNKNMML